MSVSLQLNSVVPNRQRELKTMLGETVSICVFREAKPVSQLSFDLICQ